MSKPTPPPLPPSTPSPFASSMPSAASLPAAASSVYEYVMAFDKPLTRDEKVVWLMVIVHYIQSGLLAESIYPILSNKIASLPEVLPDLKRPEERLPGSDYIYPGPPKPYQVLLKMYDGFKPEFNDGQPVSVPKRQVSSEGQSLFVLLAICLFFLIGLVGYMIGSWYMNSPLEKNRNENNGVAAVEPVAVEEKADESVTETKTDKTPEEPAQEIVTDNPFDDESLVKKFYRVEGKELLDPNGKPVRLRGVLLYSFHRITPEDIQDLKAMGTEFVLYAVGLDFPNDKYKPDSFDAYYQQQVKMLTDAGIRVIVSIYGRTLDGWNVDYRPYNNREFHGEILAQWKDMIEKLNDNPDVIGWGIFWSTLFFYQGYVRDHDHAAIVLNDYLFREIRKIDPHRPIVLPGIDWVFSGNPQKVEAPNTMILLPYEHRDKFNANVPTLCIWGFPHDNHDLREMKSIIETLETAETSWIFDCWFTRVNPHLFGQAMNWKLTEKNELMSRAMKSPESFNKNSPQYASPVSETDNPFEEDHATDNPFAE